MDFNKCSDETLIDIYRQGDEAAIEVLFERYKDILFPPDKLFVTFQAPVWGASVSIHHKKLPVNSNF